MNATATVTVVVDAMMMVIIGVILVIIAALLIVTTVRVEIAEEQVVMVAGLVVGLSYSMADNQCQ